MMNMKISDFKPNALQLYKLLGKEKYIIDGVTTIVGEPHAVADEVRGLQNILYGQLGLSAYNDLNVPWPLEKNIADVLRLCMRDYPNHYASERISRFLLRCGYQDPEVIGFLNPWDKMMFIWRDEGITIERLKASLQAANLPHDIPEDSCTKIAAWLANPITAIENDTDILGAIFGKRWVSCSLQDDDYPKPDELFSDLFNKLGLEDKIIEIEKFSKDDLRENMTILHHQTLSAVSAEEEARIRAHESDNALVRFLFREKTYVFYLRDGYSNLDADEVMGNFDAFMQSIGREERVFRLKAQEVFWHEVGHFIVAEPTQFAELMHILHISAIRANHEPGPTLGLSTRYQFPPMLPKVIDSHLVITPENATRYKNIEEVKYLEVKAECELPNLVKVLSLGVSDGGRLVAHQLSSVEDRLSVWVNSGMVANKLSRIGGELHICRAVLVDLPYLKSVGGELIVNGPTRLNAPELNSVGKSVCESGNAVLNAPKLKKVPGSETRISKIDTLYWRAESPKAM